MTTKLTPLFSRVIIEKEIAATQTPGGLYIPEQATDIPMRGTVVAVGPGKILPNGEIQKMTLKVGDKVVFGKYAGSEVAIEKKKLLLLLEEDVFAKVEEIADDHAAS